MILCRYTCLYYIYVWKLTNTQIASPTGKTTTIRCTVIRETVGSRHHGGPVEVLPEIPRTLQHYGIEGFKRGPEFRPHYAEVHFSCR